ncbi:hypothetical protein HAP94_07070 [Acidithiobacillus ferrivorans]|nr:hypothetical protein [Acidithiobacillus ferrivorans]
MFSFAIGFLLQLLYTFDVWYGMIRVLWALALLEFGLALAQYADKTGPLDWIAWGFFLGFIWESLRGLFNIMNALANAWAAWRQKKVIPPRDMPRFLLEYQVSAYRYYRDFFQYELVSAWAGISLLASDMLVLFFLIFSTVYFCVYFTSGVPIFPISDFLLFGFLPVIAISACVQSTLQIRLVMKLRTVGDIHTPSEARFAAIATYLPAGTSPWNFLEKAKVCGSHITKPTALFRSDIMAIIIRSTPLLALFQGIAHGFGQEQAFLLLMVIFSLIALIITAFIAMVRHGDWNPSSALPCNYYPLACLCADLARHYGVS